MRGGVQGAIDEHDDATVARLQCQSVLAYSIKAVDSCGNLQALHSTESASHRVSRIMYMFRAVAGVRHTVSAPM